MDSSGSRIWEDLTKHEFSYLLTPLNLKANLKNLKQKLLKNSLDLRIYFDKKTGILVGEGMTTSEARATMKKLFKTTEVTLPLYQVSSF